LIVQFAEVTKAMSEQATSSREIMSATADLEQQARQATAAVEEQGASLKQISAGSANITKQVKLIAAANLENSKSTTVILDRIQEARDLSRQNKESTRNLERILQGSPGSPTSSRKPNGPYKPKSAVLEGKGRA
jgi:methyl-accepting chemotaxis protein